MTNFELAEWLNRLGSVHTHSLNAFVKIVAFSFLAILLRYIIVSGLFYYFFWKRKNTFHCLHSKILKTNQIKLEFFWSVISCIIFALAFYVLIWLWQNGYTQIYVNIDRFSYFYLFISFILLLGIHEIYFYFTHLLMHKPIFYKKIHQVHHYSTHVTPWASFSFHPYETLIHALFIPIFILIIPIHPIVIFCYLIFMTVTAVSNHLGYELIKSHMIKSWFISGEHHGIHHEKFKYNFGLYFTILDKWLNTEYIQFKKGNSL